ncbi:MAG: CPBP family intramembrane metalloprotease [Actinobacteria bacterium]|nr:CPBP family intramembrane metalloprotease [Actinomycetota bacterium]
MKKIDKKGIFWFLFITFGLTIGITTILWLFGISFIGKGALVSQLVISGAMLIPGISAFIVRKFITKEGFSDAGLKFGSGKLYLKTYIFIPFIFVVIYGITAVFYKPDFSLSSFVTQYGVSPPIPPSLMIIAIVISSLTFATVINSAFAFGEEFGWRGYLLPKLLPLGKVKALVISGIVWGLWHVPFILLLGFHYGEDKILGAIVFTILIMFLGIYIGYLRLKSGSVFLASFAHGVFNAQFYGVWILIFPSVDVLLGGRTGLIGILVFMIIALWILMLKIKKLSS